MDSSKKIEASNDQHISQDQKFSFTNFKNQNRQNDHTNFKVCVKTRLWTWCLKLNGKNRGKNSFWVGVEIFFFKKQKQKVNAVLNCFTLVACQLALGIDVDVWSIIEALQQRVMRKSRVCGAFVFLFVCASVCGNSWCVCPFVFDDVGACQRRARQTQVKKVMWHTDGPRNQNKYEFHNCWGRI